MQEIVRAVKMLSPEMESEARVTSSYGGPESAYFPPILPHDKVTHNLKFDLDFYPVPLSDFISKAQIGGSRGGGARDGYPPLGSIFFHFHAVFGKIWKR